MTDFTAFHVFVVIACAVLLDSILGEPKRYHPLVYFGQLATSLEKRLNQTEGVSTQQQKVLGIGAVVLCLLPCVFITWATVFMLSDIKLILETLILYLAIGHKSLIQHADRVYQSLLAKDLPAARNNVAMIVSRDTHGMNQSQVTQATIESVLENGNDAIFGVLFWYLLAGAPGVVLYRLTNTLDAMWGYRTPRFLYFGWAAAKLDDLVNWIPSRLCALTYAVLGNFRGAIDSWIAQARLWESRNAGSVMSAGAGALGVILGGVARYHGKDIPRPQLGVGNTPVPEDIKRSTLIVSRGVYFWIATVFLASTLITIMIVVSVYNYA